MRTINFQLIAILLLSGGLWACQSNAQSPDKLAKEFGDQPVKEEIDPINKTEAEWKKELTADEFQVLREEGTEPAFSGDLLNVKKEGVYICGACGLPLFATKHKFESGTGWPSFYKPIEMGVVRYVADNAFGMQRVEVECGRCESHLGHVFRDGPEPTGLRYCLNSLALDFEKEE